MNKNLSCLNCQFCVPISKEMVERILNEFNETSTCFRNENEVEKFLKKYSYICLLPKSFLPVLNFANSYECEVNLSLFFLNKKHLDFAIDCAFFTERFEKIDKSKISKDKRDDENKTKKVKMKKVKAEKVKIIYDLCGNKDERKTPLKIKDKYIRSSENLINFIREFFKKLGLTPLTIKIEQFNPLVLNVKYSFGYINCERREIKMSLSRRTISFINGEYKLSLPRRILAKPFYSDMNSSHPGLLFAFVVISHFLFDDFKTAKGLVKPHTSIRVKKEGRVVR